MKLGNTISLFSSLFFCRIAAAIYDQDGWKAAADFLSEAIDPTADPCKDFYQYACGKWRETYQGRFIGEPEKTISAVAGKLLNVIKSIREKSDKTPLYQKRLKLLFDQCVQAPSDYDYALINIYNQTTKWIGPMPLLDPSGVRKLDPYHLVGKLQRLFNTKLFFGASVKLIQETCKPIPTLTLKPMFDSKLTDEFNISTFAAKLVHMGSTLGVELDEERVIERIKTLVSFEKKITDFAAKVKSSNLVTYHISQLPNKVSANISWQEFFRGLMPLRLHKRWTIRDPVVAFESIRYFRKLDTFVRKLQYDDLIDYAYLRLLDSYMVFYTITPTLLQDNITGLSEEEQCLEYALKYASAAAARLYFENIRPIPDPRTIWHWKHDLELLAEAVFAGFRYLIQSAEWLDVEDKATLIAKVNSVRFFSGIAEWILNDTAVLKHTPPYNPRHSVFENDIRMFRHKFEWQLQPLLTGHMLKITEESEWMDSYIDPEPNFNWNAFYYDDTVQLWMGLTLPPMYDHAYPIPVKMGILGWIIGHELFHGFDVENIIASRRRKHWLKNDTIDLFQKRVQCIRQQYSSYCYPEENFCVSGGETVNDNIADMEGIKVAFMAYKFLTQIAGRQRSLPGLEHLTSDQLFFLSAARIWCGTGEDVAIYKEGNEHAPGRARVELSIMNFPAFAQAFRCRTGTKFAPLHTCTLWGDFLEPNIDAS